MLAPNTDYNVTSLIAGSTPYNVTEGGTGAATRDDFIFTTDSSGTTPSSRNAAVTGANLATALANATDPDNSSGNVTWTFLGAFSSFDGFALFEATDGNGNPNNSAQFELLDASDNIVGTLDIAQSNVQQGRGSP